MTWILSFILAVPARAAAPVAEEAIRVVVLPVAVEGSLAEQFRVELADALDGGLTRGGFELIHAAVAADARCLESACVRMVTKDAAAAYAVRLIVTAEDRDYRITVELLEAETGDVVARGEEACELCGISDVREIVASQAAVIRGRLETSEAPAPVLLFVSRPPGAVIELDGEPVGTTPLERIVTEGRHWARASLDGYVSEERPVEAVVGMRERVQFELAPVPRLSDQTRARIRPWGWATLGVGIAALATGITLIAVDDQPDRIRCSGLNIDGDGDCRYLLETRNAGIGVAAAGLVLTGAAIGLLIASRKPRKRRR